MNSFAPAFAFAAAATAAPLVPALAAPTPCETVLKDLRGDDFFAQAMKVLGK